MSNSVIEYMQVLATYSF